MRLHTDTSGKGYEGSTGCEVSEEEGSASSNKSGGLAEVLVVV